VLAAGSERPLQAAEMTKASAGVVEAGARMRGQAIAREARPRLVNAIVGAARVA
jgi:hypothetical protein